MFASHFSVQSDTAQDGAHSDADARCHAGQAKSSAADHIRLPHRYIHTAGK